MSFLTITASEALSKIGRTLKKGLTAAWQYAVVIVAFLRQCSTGDKLDDWLSEIMEQTWRSLKTRENGACGIHATFGLCDSSGCELRHERPSEHIRTLFAQSLEGIRCR